MPIQNGGLFGGVFARGGADTSDTAWLQAMLDAEAGLARALERAGLAPAGSGKAVTAAAKAEDFDAAELGELAALTGNPVPGLARELARKLDGPPARVVHRGATSQDILDTAAMLLARQAIDATKADLSQLRVDSAKMAANLTAAGGLPLAERVIALLRNALGGPQAHDLVTTAAARAAASGLPLAHERAS
jgi:3-carboxy-cis,cis-muconate cycloisomerase